MVNTVNIVTSALLLSALYALVAIGFTMIFGIGGILNIAHGASIIVGAFSAYYVTLLGYSIWFGALAALVLPGVFSVLVYRFIISHIEDNEVMVIIISLVVLLIVEQVVLILEGSSAVTIPSLLEGQTRILGTPIRNNRLFVFALSWALIGALFIFINRTWMGKAIRAASMSDRGADLVGVNRRTVSITVWFIAGMMAGIAGLFFGSFQTASWNMGLEPLLLSFSIVILGGIGSIRGSVIGAYVIGTLETLTVSLIDPRLAGVTSLIVLFVVLIVKPQGLFGRAEVN